MNTRRTAVLGRMAAASALLSSVTVTMAQEADTSRNESIISEVVVTAQRREESLQEVPMSLQVFDQESITKSGIKDIEDIVRMTPGLNVVPTGGLASGPTNVSIRGVSGSAGQATTGIYIDDTPVQVRFLGGGRGADSAYPAVFDLARIEILRGPQGTLFGAGSEGGAVRFITTEPSLTEWSGHARSEVSSIDGGDLGYQFGLAGGGPLVSDRLGFRASAYYRKDAGWIDREPYTNNVVSQRTPVAIHAEDDVNSTTVKSATAALTWRISDSFSLTPSVMWQQEERSDVGIYWRELSDPQSGRFVDGQLFSSPTQDEFTLSSLKALWETGAADVYSITSYMDRTRDSRRDYSFGITGFVLPAFLPPGTPLPSGLEYPIIPASSEHADPQQQFTQEVRIQSRSSSGDALNWVFGVFYQDIKQRASQSLHTPGFDDLLGFFLPGLTVEGAFGAPLLQPGDVAYVETASSRDKQTAAFAQVDYKVVPKLTLTAGLRYAHTGFEFANDLRGPLTGGGSSGAASSSQDDWLPKFGVKYEPADNLMMYATAARGFRPGGANLEAAPACAPSLAEFGLDSVPEFGADYVWSYEAGVKGNSSGGRFLWDVGAFFIDWTEIQRGVNMASCQVEFIANLGSAVSKGADLQLSAALVDDLIFGLAVGYTDSYFEDTVVLGSAPPLVVSGQKLPTPPWTIVSSLDYSFSPFANPSEMYLMLENQYSTSYHTETPGELSDDPDTSRYGASNNTSVRLGMRFGAGWDASLFVTNVFDETPKLVNPSYFGIVRGYTLQPRTVGLTVRTNF
jgi:Outer membrane receptor proteins, mostly Fe transport